MTNLYNPNTIAFTPFLFFTGKGGVGKTSTACATAITLADMGKKVLLISTDPASNLQDVFEIELTNKPKEIPSVPNLQVANLDPETAAHEYKERVVGPYRGKLPDAVIATMEEQLSGACTVEMAAFDEFSTLLTNKELTSKFDHIIFDTAPTGHTLRLLQLPTAWSGFLEESTHGASCLGPLAGLGDKKELYNQTVQALSNPNQTMLMLVTRPDSSPLQEAERAAHELKEIGVSNQFLLVNGILKDYMQNDNVSNALFKRQSRALENMAEELKNLPTYEIPLVPFNVTGIENMRKLVQPMENLLISDEEANTVSIPSLQTLITNLSESGKRVIFTMGKGGVGKTTVASAIAVGLAEKGHHVHLTTTDPAAHIDYVMHGEQGNITVSRIDPKVEVENYRKEVIEQAKDTVDEEGLAYLEEDLRSPCTEEIAVFRALADIVERANDEIVVIDTAPTGHTLLLLDAAQTYHKEIARSTGEVPQSVKNLLPRLRNPEETSVVIVTLAEATPVHEASRLQEDLKRADITPKWWVINQSFYATHTSDFVLRGRAQSEIQWIQEVQKESQNNCVIIPWQSEDIVGYEKLKELVK
ncbi:MULTISPECIES: arsenical pump-driving ATPase [Bacillus]|jgi:arsenite-transporting ATPase|uniref:Arsenic ABC transporter ATPase n=16 Tax=Bacillus TaxID=1386 RepID=A1BZT0_BACCE|nr:MULTISPECIES: arsenical pump-driving ATPase [Bacillus]AAS45006.1 arsenite-translocating ATPase ArsA [Bacillus cereus ATCC 10987]EEK75762.1 Arsenite-translocating ATPase ArsA [Bacillus cereus R309803]KXY85046.1 arsenical pump-driving ATPase [Bacillus wiedmannii]MCO4219735.1 arsenical pump-driving ATPase [Bacillus sp. 10017]MDV8113567.1 arsenical pump-driving ATPase [Bacillus sp. BAU-SS-2023]CJB72115.1 Arsenical pump-driving ATPase [Streptococcus pneumoniae]HDR7336690.1 arsenical pump-drivi